MTFDPHNNFLKSDQEDFKLIGKGSRWTLSICIHAKPDVIQSNSFNTGKKSQRSQHALWETITNKRDSNETYGLRFL